MPLPTQPYKGTRDFYPEDKRLQNYIFSIWREVAERYGYEEYDAPLIEPLDIYRAKTGEEIVNEQLYSFKDRGGREVAIRPEMTPSVSRMVAGKRQELSYPLRWYSIPNLMRYERPQRGRLREHWQLNVDLFGEDGLSAEQEMICMSADLMKAFGAKETDYAIRLNSRKLVDKITSDYLKLNRKQTNDFIKLMDKSSKIEEAEFKRDLGEIIPDKDKLDKAIKLTAVDKLDALPNELADESTNMLKELLNMLSKAKIGNVVFDPALMRGFDYYTDIVFEVFDKNPDNNRSMFGGGRYDGLVGLFGVEPVPTVGLGMGDVTLENFLRSNDLLPKLDTAENLRVILIGDVYTEAFPVVDKLRSQSLNTSVDASDRKLDKKIKSADKSGVKYALFIGEEELKSEKFTLKDLSGGKESKLTIDQVVSTLKG